MKNESQYINQKIRQHFRSLNPDNEPTKAVWLMSRANDREESVAGQMVSVYVGHTQPVNSPLPPNVFTAPRLVAEDTHRVATDKEVEAYLADEQIKREALIKADTDRKLNMNVQVQNDPEFMKLVMAMAQQLIDQRKADEPKTGKAK
jgi:hypothetical protein